MSHERSLKTSSAKKRLLNVCAVSYVKKKSGWKYMRASEQLNGAFHLPEVTGRTGQSKNEKHQLLRNERATYYQTSQTCRTG